MVPRTLRARIAAALAFTVILTIALAGITFFALERNSQRNQALRTLRLVAVPVRAGFVLREQARANPRLSGLLTRAFFDSIAQEGNVAVAVLNGDGVVIAEPDVTSSMNLLGQRFPLPDPAAPRPLLALREGSLTTTQGRRLLYATGYLTAPNASNRLHGVAFVVAIPTETAAEIAGSFTPRLAISGALALAVALVVGLLLARAATRPLGRVERLAVDVAGGDYGGRLQEEGPEETRLVVRSLNHMLDAVQSSQEAMQHFLADASHELRTPLTAINGFAQALEDGTITDETARARAHNLIQNESRRLLRLVEELLDLSRLEGGQVRLERSPIQAGELLRHVADVFSLRAEDAEIGLAVSAIDDLHLYGDFDRLEQVFTNLLDNALRYTPKGGAVTLAAGREAGQAVVTVTDTGLGIPPEELPHVFERFYHGKRGSTGLGLAIAREIVRAHGGTVEIDNAPGAGARFTVRLPLAETPGRTPTVTRA